MAINLAYWLVGRAAVAAFGGLPGTIKRCDALGMYVVSGPSHPS